MTRITMRAGVRRCALLALALAACSGARDAGEPAVSDTQQAQPLPASGGTPDERVHRADAARIAGSPDARVWVVIVSDFQCPYCKRWHDETAEALDREFVQTGKVRLAYVHFPLRQHQHAMPAAEASMCGGAQGKFWEFQDRIFATAEEWTPLPDAAPVFARIATEVGLDTATYRACVESQVMRPMIQADYQRGVTAGVNSTPSFLIGNEVLSGALPIERFREAIARATSSAP